MRFTTLFGTAAALLSAHSAAASDAHRRLHSHNNLVALEKKHAHGHLQVRETEKAQPAKRGGQCAFPTDDDNLVAVTPGSKNAGWAMPPDQACEPDSYCPIACKPGMVMAQWKPDTTYQYPESMYGGLYCDKNGNIKKPFPNKPNCVPGTGAVKAVNKCGKKMSFCQTVLPGMEDMIIPTLVSDSATLAVPGPSYWGSTAAHFYVNPPGSEEKDCIWGDESNPIGNWSPYVAGTNTDDAGLSYVKLGLNPIWLDSPLKSTKPDFGLKIECDGDCPGLPCSIDISGSSPTIKGLTADTGAGGANFCVVTVPKGQTARIVAYSADGGSGDSDESESPKEEKPKPSPKPEPKPKPKPSPKPEPKPEPVETTSEEPEPTTTTPPPPPPPSTTPEESTTEPETTEEPTTTSEKPSTSSSSMQRPTYKPGVFRENGTDPTPTMAYESTSISKSKPTDTSDGPTDTGSEEPETKDEDNEAGRKGGSAPLAGLVVAFVAAACFF